MVKYKVSKTVKVDIDFDSSSINNKESSEMGMNTSSGSRGQAR